MEVSRKGIERNKLTLLHILREFGTQLSDNQLLEMATELDLMGYFDLNSGLRDLADNGLLKRDEAINGIFYSITPMGSETLDFFKKQLPYSLRQELAEYAERHRDELSLQSRIFSEYLEIGEDQYRVLLRLVEKSIPIFEISFFANSRQEAELYVNSWRKNALTVYENTFKGLLETGSTEHEL